TVKRRKPALRERADPFRNLVETLFSVTRCWKNVLVNREGTGNGTRKNHRVLITPDRGTLVMAVHEHVFF
ncbi:MAG: hypothetical protein PHU03_05405, partial [Syntrophales bacterium]|nr:hypothetical protein [Syntrophales bacterium]